MELFFKMQFVKNVLVCVFGVFTFSVFCYCFYEGFIPKIILVSWFLLFICISYLVKLFRFDTGILRDSVAVPLLKTLSRLPQSVAFYAWCCFTHLLAIFSFLYICNNDLLNVNRRVAESCCSHGFSCAFSWLWPKSHFLVNFQFWFG